MAIPEKGGKRGTDSRSDKKHSHAKSKEGEILKQTKEKGKAAMNGNDV